MAGSIGTETPPKKAVNRETLSMELIKAALMLGAVLILFFFFSPMAVADDFTRIPVKGRVTMVDLGAKKCIP